MSCEQSADEGYCPRARYAMSGTDLAYAATRALYAAEPRTRYPSLLCAPVRCPVLAYAMSGTDIADCATGLRAC
eukprot:1344978-Rhodomonas_salina.1